VDLDPTAELLERLARAVMDRGLRVPLERQIRLGDAAQALADLKAGRGSGKTVIDVSS
jgi:NADPH:quinone reductase-like Zn-dependent oxidoreductase